MGQLATAVHGRPLLQRCCGKSPCDGSGSLERVLQRRSAGPRRSSDVAPPIVHDVLAGAGRPLPEHVRSDMDARFRQDFSGVRVHTDANAAASARAVSARAYTVGQHVVFGSGEYQPETATGRSVLAHELAHTVQQRGTTQLARSPLVVGPTDDPRERQADSAASDAAGRAPGGELGHGAASRGSPVLQRLGDPTRVPPGLTCPVASSTPASVFMSVEFPQGSSALSPVDAGRLQGVIAAWEAAGSNPTIRVDGYASPEGTDENNWRLSCDRANAVFGELTAYTSGPPGIPEASIETFAQGETSEFGPTLAPNRRVTLSASAPLPAPVCTHPGVARVADVQPVFFRSNPADASPTGGSFPNRLAVANEVWGKVGVTFRSSSAVTIDSALKSTGGSLPERNAIRALRSGGGVEVFMMDNELRDAGGGATTGSGTAGAKVVMTDGGSSSTLLAHELGHVLGLQHPGSGTPQDGEAGTIAEPSSSRDVENPRRNTMTNYRAIVFPPGTGSTCLNPDP